MKNLGLDFGLCAEATWSKFRGDWEREAPNSQSKWKFRYGIEKFWHLNSFLNYYWTESNIGQNRPKFFDFVSNVGISNVIIAVHQHIGDGSWFQFFERFSKICNNLNFFCDSEVSREGAGYCTIHFTAYRAKIGLANHSTRTLTHTWVCFLGERIKMLVFSHAAAAFCFRCFNFTLHRNEQA